tara:strand:+ start:316 stop:606 length:291 start_codon:yes stop_codon:yes gene_type:complete
MSSSCSFRITRTAEDLAQTMNSLSQRLIKLENRLEAIELRFKEEVDEPPAEEIKMLDGVDQILRECQELLETSTTITSDVEEDSWPPNVEDEDLAA